MAVLGAAAGGGEFPQFFFYTSETWAPPQDGNICIHAIGAGGGGMGRNSTNYRSGGGGGYAKLNSLAVTTSGSFTITIGALGWGSSNNNSASAGGTTTVAGTGISSNLTAGGGGLARCAGAGGVRSARSERWRVSLAGCKSFAAVPQAGHPRGVSPRNARSGGPHAAAVTPRGQRGLWTKSWRRRAWRDCGPSNSSS